jgi:CBS-domain-containing membrane protein
MTIPAKSVMTRDIVTVSPETTIVETAQRMLIHHISAVPVVDPITGRLDWSAKAT